MLASPSSAACSKIVARWPPCAMLIAAARPPRPAPTIAMWNCAFVSASGILFSELSGNLG